MAMWCYAEMVVVCGSVCGLRNKIGRKLGGKWSGGWSCCCQGPDVRANGWMSGLVGPDVRARDPWMNTAWRGQIRAKFGGICGRKLVKNGWEARSTQNKANPRIQTNKISTHQQIRKKLLGLFLVGNFRIRTKNNKTRLETQRGGSEIVSNLAHDTKMM